MTDSNIILGEYSNNTCYSSTEFDPCCAKIPLILIPTSCIDPDPDISEGLYDVISNLGQILIDTNMEIR